MQHEAYPLALFTNFCLCWWWASCIEMELKAAAKMGSCDKLSRNLPSQQLTVQHFETGRVLSTALLFQGSAHLAMSDAFALRKTDVFIWQEVHWVLMMMMANNHAPLLCLQLLFHCHDLWQTGDSSSFLHKSITTFLCPHLNAKKNMLRCQMYACTSVKSLQSWTVLPSAQLWWKPEFCFLLHAMTHCYMTEIRSVTGWCNSSNMLWCLRFAHKCARSSFR